MQFDWSIPVQDQEIHSPVACIFHTFSQHPACMDRAILHGKPFGIPLLMRNSMPTLPITFYYTKNKAIPEPLYVEELLKLTQSLVFL